MRRLLLLLAVLSLVAGCAQATPEATGEPLPQATTPKPPRLPVLPETGPLVVAEAPVAAGPDDVEVADGLTTAPGPPAFALEPVTTLLPEIHLTPPDGGPLDSDVVAAALATPGVSFATVASIGPVVMTLPDGRRGELTVAAVDPAGYRMMVPQITADVPALWERLVAGDLAVDHERAADLDLTLDDVITTQAGPLRLSVIAAFGQPVLSSGVVGLDRAPALGLGAPSTLLVAVEPQAWPDEVADVLERALGLDATLVYGKPQRRRADLPSGTVWDRLAMCEASGNWAANTGNGYFGGLQFLPSSWQLVGGVGLPHEASRDEQILRGELLLQRQGWRAWPVCSVRLGLRQPGPGEGPDGRPQRAAPPPQPQSPPPEQAEAPTPSEPAED